MDPKEFTWTEDQQITVTNPTAEDFKWMVHSKQYELKAGQSAKMPGYIAWLYVYNQSVKMAQAEGSFNRWNEEGFRTTLYERFVAGVDDLVQAVVTPEPELVEVLDEPEEEVEESEDEEGQEPEQDETANPAPGTGKNFKREPVKYKVPSGSSTKA